MLIIASTYSFEMTKPSHKFWQCLKFISFEEIESKNRYFLVLASGYYGKRPSARELARMHTAAKTYHSHKMIRIYVDPVHVEEFPIQANLGMNEGRTVACMQACRTKTRARWVSSCQFTMFQYKTYFSNWSLNAFVRSSSWVGGICRTNLRPPITHTVKTPPPKKQ